MERKGRGLVEIAEDWANIGTVDDAILVISALSDAFSRDYALVQAGTKTLGAFANVVGDAGAALGGDTLVLGRIEALVKADIETLDGMHIYANKPSSPPEFNRTMIESHDAEQAMVEYARVSAICTSKIERIDVSLDELAQEKVRLTGIRDDTKAAAFRGDELEAIFAEFNAKGISLIIGTDKIWFDLKAHVNEQLGLRWTAADAVLKRIEARIAFLGKERRRLQTLDDTADLFWWHELILHQNEDPFTSDGEAAAVLKKAKEVSTHLPGTPEKVTSIADGVAIFNTAMREQVARLAADAAKASSKAERIGQMLAIFELIRSGFEVANELSGGSDPAPQEGGKQEKASGAAPSKTLKSGSKTKTSTPLKSSGSKVKKFKRRKLAPQQTLKLKNLGMSESFPYWSHRYGIDFS